jgi:hypothetical protein
MPRFPSNRYGEYRPSSPRSHYRKNQKYRDPRHNFHRDRKVHLRRCVRRCTVHFLPSHEQQRKRQQQETLDVGGDRDRIISGEAARVNQRSGIDGDVRVDLVDVVDTHESNNHPLYGFTGRVAAARGIPAAQNGVPDEYRTPEFGRTSGKGVHLGIATGDLLPDNSGVGQRRRGCRRYGRNRSRRQYPCGS